MAKIRAPFSNGADNQNTRRFTLGIDTNVMVNSLNVGSEASITATVAGLEITPDMVNDNDLFFVAQTGAGTDKIILSDDLPIGTFIHFFATAIFTLHTETATDVINNIASKGWTIPAADDIIHCLKTHAANWQCTEETKAGLDVQVIPNT